MKRVLVAGIGNTFLGDDGFGVAVVRKLARQTLPPGVLAMDYGIRSLHLAFALLSPPDLLVLVDAVSRGEAPGTLYVLDPVEPPARGGAPYAVQIADAHDMHPGTVFDALRALGGKPPPALIVGCEPLDCSPRDDLSALVQRAVGPALGMIRKIIDAEVNEV